MQNKPKPIERYLRPVGKKGTPRSAESYRGYIRNTTGEFEQRRLEVRARWRSLNLAR